MQGLSVLWCGCFAGGNPCDPGPRQTICRLVGSNPTQCDLPAQARDAARLALVRGPWCGLGAQVAEVTARAGFAGMTAAQIRARMAEAAAKTPEQRVIAGASQTSQARPDPYGVRVLYPLRTVNFKP